MTLSMWYLVQRLHAVSLSGANESGKIRQSRKISAFGRSCVMVAWRSISHKHKHASAQATTNRKAAQPQQQSKRREKKDTRPAETLVKERQQQQRRMVSTQSEWTVDTGELKTIIPKKRSGSKQKK
jgi:hypothetical protein